MPNRNTAGLSGTLEDERDIASGLRTAPSVNQSNLNYLSMGIPNYSGLTQTESGNIANLLHPTDFSDVQRRAAEQAVGGGYSGSNFAGVEGLHMTEEERIRRQLLGSQMLSGAAARLPRPFDPASFLRSGGGGSDPTSGHIPGTALTTTGPGPGGPISPPLRSPGEAPPVILPGTNPNSNHNWLADIISRYSPESSAAGGETPLWQMKSGVGPQYGAVDMGGNVDEYGFPTDYANELNAPPPPPADDEEENY